MSEQQIKIPGLDVILVRGGDAAAFLQGQITNDINLLDKDRGIYAGYCNPKGRLIAFFLIIKTWDNYFLFCPSSISDEIRKRLSMFILRSQVIIEKSKYSYFYFYGNTYAEEAFKNIWGGVPFPTKLMETVQHPNEQNTTGLLSITKLPGENGRFLVLGEDETIEMICRKVFQNDEIPNEISWNASDIEAKIPNIFSETQGKFIPQSLNLDLMDAINFKKGCYTGQEIVARTHYLGKVKRRMYQANLESDEVIKYGEEIYLNNEIIGHIVNFSKRDSAYKLLVELKVEADDKSITLKNKPLKIFKHDNSA